MKDRAIFTVAIGERFSKIAELTHPTMQRYADKIGAEFIVMRDSDKHPSWTKLELYNLLREYKHVISLDTDIIVRDDCPDLFDLVPEEKIGMFNEGMFASREASLREACYKYKRDIPKWDGRYYNAGVMVVSRKHRNLFSPPKTIEDLGMWEQGYLNMRIISENISVEELEHNFNRMSLMDSLLGITRHDSYIVHYAGAPAEFDLCSVIRKDLNRWAQDAPDYKYPRNIAIYLGGGIGDQLCGEPVARHIINKLYAREERKTNFFVITHWPELFTHLTVPVLKRDQWMPQEDPVRVMHTLPSPEDSVMWKVWTHIKAHTVDFAGLAAIGQILPDDDKHIMLKVELSGVKEFLEIGGGVLNTVLVHPGRGWPSKTFPASWWNAVIQGLVDAGLKVGVIGKHVGDDQGYVDVNIPAGAVDYRDLLSLNGLVALISNAPVLITNDSAPVHIAGAFDNHIILIPSCKHPDCILPYRNGGDKHYKSIALYKKLTCDDWDSSPTRLYKQTADQVKGSIIDYLPEPEKVVSVAVDAMTRNVKECNESTDGIQQIAVPV